MPSPYVSEVKYLGGATLDFIEVVVDGGTSVANLVVTIYHPDGSVRSTNALSSLTPTTVAGKDVYVIESGSPNTFTGLSKSGGVALSDNNTVHQFISFSDNAATITATGGAANGLTSTEIGQAGSGKSLETTDGGATYNVQTTPSKGSIPCLTRGTMVQTDEGAVKVECLKPGMRLLTIDRTYEPIRMVLSKPITQDELLINENLAPVRITAGALGNGLPKVDLLVSRQHRMLISSPIAKRMFGETSVLIAAIRLTILPGIYVDTSIPEVEYFHLLMDQHCVVFAEGAPTESLFVGEQVQSILPVDTMEEIKLLFPHVINANLHPKPARLIPDPKRQKRLVERHAKNACALLCLYQLPQQLIAA